MVPMPTPNHPAEAQSTPLGWQVAHGSCVIQMRAPYPRLYPHVTPQLSGKVKQFAYQFTDHVEFGGESQPGQKYLQITSKSAPATF